MLSGRTRSPREDLVQAHSEKRSSFARRALPLVALLTAGLAAGWWLRGCIAVDACLDAGGTWQEGGSYCEGVPVR